MKGNEERSTNRKFKTKLPAADQSLSSKKTYTAKNSVISPISWCGNFVERYSFRIVSGESRISRYVSD